MRYCVPDDNTFNLAECSNGFTCIGSNSVCRRFEFMAGNAGERKRVRKEEKDKNREWRNFNTIYRRLMSTKLDGTGDGIYRISVRYSVQIAMELILALVRCMRHMNYNDLHRQRHRRWPDRKSRNRPAQNGPDFAMTPLSSTAVYRLHRPSLSTGKTLRA